MWKTRKRITLIISLRVHVSKQKALISDLVSSLRCLICCRHSTEIKLTYEDIEGKKHF